jgi:hypothetical protein
VSDYVDERCPNFGRHEWSEPYYYRRDDAERIVVEGCAHCCATRVTVPNGVDVFEELGLVIAESQPDTEIWADARDPMPLPGSRHLRLVPALGGDS